MKLIGERTVVEGCGEGSAGGGGGGKVVVVGVKFDSASRELLTWALVKMAEPGDRVVALHVLDSFTESTGSLLSLVKTFDSMLSVYDGFCKLKQVNLKLKVCRGSSVRDILVREARSCGAAKVIVGTSKTHHTIRSSVSVAKYCARKLSKKFWVFAVNNGKIVFQREATCTNADHSEDDNSHKGLVRLVHRSSSKNMKLISDGNYEESQLSSEQSILGFRRKSFKKSCPSCDSGTQLSEESPEEDNKENDLALVPFHSSDVALRSGIIQASSGWPFLRRVFFTKPQHPDKSSLKKASSFQWVLRLPTRHSSAVVFPDHKATSGHPNEDHFSEPDQENMAIVPVASEAAGPDSPFNGLTGIPKELEGLHEKYSSTCRLFTYQELVSATSNFIPENLVGKGGSSHVYRGCLLDSKELAIKVLKPSEDLLKEFVSEIEIITNLHHKNIISLLGFCFEDQKLLLVYDFLSRGSLEENLHGNKKDEKAFSWHERYRVALGVAEALDYLHNCCAEPVIHRDVKSSNILLSDDFEPRLSDFGLANLVSTSLSHITCTDVAGTFGYLAPEYFMNGKVSEKIDVYAFGVVLLELLSGRKPIDSNNLKGQESLVMWAKPILKSGKVTDLLDPHQPSDYDNDHIDRMVLAASLCIRRAPKFRPQISLVLKLLQGDEEIIKWARQQVKESEELDTIDEEAFPTNNIQSHLNLALLDLEDDSVSSSSTERSISVEDYLRGRWSHSSSFD